MLKKLFLAVLLALFSFSLFLVVLVRVTKNFTYERFNISTNIPGQLLLYSRQKLTVWQEVLDQANISGVTNLHLRQGSEDGYFEIELINLTFELGTTNSARLLDEFRSAGQMVYQVEITSQAELTNNKQLNLIAYINPDYWSQLNSTDKNELINGILNKVIFVISPYTYNQEEYLSLSKKQLTRAIQMPLLGEVINFVRADVIDPPCNDAYNCTCSDGGQPCTL